MTTINPLTGNKIKIGGALYKKLVKEGIIYKKTTWKNAKTFFDCQSLMIDFLDGKLDRNPWYIGKLTDDVIPLVKTLRQINAIGFLTNDSQPGDCIYDNHVPRGSNIGRLFSEEQKAYICGYIEDSEILKILIEKCVDTDKLIILVYNFLEGKEYIYGDIDNDDMINNYIWVTRDRFEKGVWDYPTSSSINIKETAISDLSLLEGKNPFVANIFFNTTSYVIIIKKKKCTKLYDSIRDALCAYARKIYKLS